MHSHSPTAGDHVHDDNSLLSAWVLSLLLSRSRCRSFSLAHWDRAGQPPLCASVYPSARWRYALCCIIIEVEATPLTRWVDIELYRPTGISPVESQTLSTEPPQLVSVINCVAIIYLSLNHFTTTTTNLQSKCTVHCIRLYCSIVRARSMLHAWLMQGYTVV